MRRSEGLAAVVATVGLACSTTRYARRVYAEGLQSVITSIQENPLRGLRLTNRNRRFKDIQPT